MSKITSAITLVKQASSLITLPATAFSPSLKNIEPRVPGRAGELLENTAD
jgi:hypothetical protein